MLPRPLIVVSSAIGSACLLAAAIAVVPSGWRPLGMVLAVILGAAIGFGITTEAP